MKTKIALRIPALLLALIVAGNLIGQTSLNNFQSVVTAKPYPKVYENIKTEFDKMFSGSENVRWENVGKNFLAKFSMGDVQKRALLNPKAQLVYEITYGTEKHLPTSIRKNVKRNYVEYKITAATHIEEANRKIWVINLEDEASYVIVRVENDEFEEVKVYTKSKP
jgi:hypothetical protein